MTSRTTTQQAPTRALSTARTVIVCLAVLLEGMSSSSINVQIHGIRSDLGLGGAELQIVVGAFLLAYAGCLPVAGRLADVWSRRAAFRAGIVLFGLGSLVCAIAVAPGMLVAGRLVQGVGAALSAPAALALITAGLEHGARRNRAVAIYGAMGAAGFSLGLVLPGFVVAQVGWRMSFLLLLPFVLLVLLATARMPTNRPDGGTVDLVGATLLTAALVVAMHAIGGVGTFPWLLLATEAGAVVVLVLLLVRRGGIANYPTAVVTHPRIVAACVAIATTYAASLATMFVLSLGLQIRAGVDAFMLGLLVLPQPLFFALTAGLGSRLVSRLRPVPVLAAGGLVLATSLALLAVAGATTPWWQSVLPAMAGVGASLGLIFPAASIMVVDAAAEEHRGTAASLLTTAQNVGGALGVASMSALALVPEATNAVGVRPSMVAGVVMTLLGALLVAGLVRRGTSGATFAEPRWTSSS